MAKLKLKKKVKKVIVFSIILVILLVVGIRKYNEYKYHQTYEYKLLTVGYTIDDTKILIDKLDNSDLDKLLVEEVNEYIISILKEKYYMKKNLYDYLDYKENNKDTSYSDVISIVNVGAHKEWYDKDYVKEVDMSKGNLILVNKFNYLSEDFVPSDITNISLSYSYSGNEAIKEVNDAYVEMAKNAKKDGITLLVNSSYRDYKEQDEIYKEFYLKEGVSYADKYAARAGYSEHQTGLCLDIFTSGHSTTKNFEESDAYNWLINNSYKYGFILRYPKGKEYLTGYEYESWHYRYLGVDTATKVFESNLTYDEYYAFYLS